MTPLPDLDASLLTARRQARDNSAAEQCVQHVNVVLHRVPLEDHFYVGGYCCSDWEDGTTIETWINGRLHSANR